MPAALAFRSLSRVSARLRARNRALISTFCYSRVQGARAQVPSQEEYQAVIQGAEMSIHVNFTDSTQLSVPIDSSSTVQELLMAVRKRYMGICVRVSLFSGRFLST